MLLLQRGVVSSAVAMENAQEHANARGSVGNLVAEVLECNGEKAQKRDERFGHSDSADVVA
jgi:hypothetical protein